MIQWGNTLTNYFMRYSMFVHFSSELMNLLYEQFFLEATVCDRAWWQTNGISSSLALASISQYAWWKNKKSTPIKFWLLIYLEEVVDRLEQNKSMNVPRPQSFETQTAKSLIENIVARVIHVEWQGYLFCRPLKIPLKKS